MNNNNNNNNPKRLILKFFKKNLMNKFIPYYIDLMNFKLYSLENIFFFEKYIVWKTQLLEMNKKKFKSLKKELKNNEKIILTEILFSSHFHFGPYFFIFPFLVSKMKNVFHFGSYRYFANENYLHDRWSALLVH